MLRVISSSSPAQSMSSCRSPRRRSGGSGFTGPRRGMDTTIDRTSRTVIPRPDLEVLAADVHVAVRREPAKRLVQGLQRAVPRCVAEDVAGPVDARGDAAADVVAGDPGVLGADPSFELRPGGEAEPRFAEDPSASPGGKVAQLHRLLRRPVDARPERRRPR